MPDNDWLHQRSEAAAQRAWSNGPIPDLNEKWAKKSEISGQFKPHQLFPCVPLEGVDPYITGVSGLLTKTVLIGSMGSCFAAEMKSWLTAHGYNYVQTEQGEGTEGGSARFGLLFNTASIRQVAQTAVGQFKPRERWWALDGRLRDPYRRGVTWANEAEAEQDLRSHSAAVKAMFERSELLIVTPGLSEVWRHREDGATFFGIPPRRVFDKGRHEHALQSVDEAAADLQTFYDIAREINPRLKLIVSLSPVPLLATFREMCCVQADAVSKAVLRVAIDAFCRRNPGVIYFPSYEIVTKMTTTGAWENDNRHVKVAVVDRIMRYFASQFGVPAVAAEAA